MTRKPRQKKRPVQSSEAIFRRTLWRWWKTHRRNFPWRNTTDPYAILVSEIMLQQTQAERVVGYYERFLKQYPTAMALAGARQSEVVRLWSGLGYNRRARNLHQAAKAFNEQWFSQSLSFEQLIALPGVGGYTARAALAFAYNKPAAPVDTNIARIYTRHFGKRATGDLQGFADRMVPPGRSRDWSGMLMDFGALVCTANHPDCEMLGLRHVAEVAPKRQQAAFRDSDRFWRGRIVEVLRSEREPMTVAGVRRAAEGLGTTTLPKERAERLITGLAGEGLIHRERSRIMLA